jgi:hypothetical protein
MKDTTVSIEKDRNLKSPDPTQIFSSATATTAIATTATPATILPGSTLLKQINQEKNPDAHAKMEQGQLHNSYLILKATPPEAGRLLMTPKIMTPKMSTCRSFTCFQALPPELRQMIWAEALTVPSVWVVAGRDATDRAAIDKRLSAPMTCIGPPPYLAGFACREARQMLVMIYGRPIHVSGSPSTSTALYWINLDRTVIVLNPPVDCSPGYDAFFALDALTALKPFGVYALSRLEHIAITLCYFTAATIGRFLAANCPALRTVIIQLAVYKGDVLPMAPRPLDPHTANYYAKLLDYQGPELVCKEIDEAHLRRLFCCYFSNTPPRLHLRLMTCTRRPPWCIVLRRAYPPQAQGGNTHSTPT